VQAQHVVHDPFSGVSPKLAAIGLAKRGGTKRARKWAPPAGQQVAPPHVAKLWNMDGAHSIPLEVESGWVDGWQRITVVDFSLLSSSEDFSTFAQHSTAIDSSLATASEQIGNRAWVLAEQNT